MQKREFDILYTKKVEKELSRLASTDIRRTLSQISKLSFPFSKNLDIRKMVNTPRFFRLKFGKVRVIFEVDSQTSEIWIRKIGYRKDIYR